MSKIQLSSRFIEERYSVHADEFLNSARRALTSVIEKSCEGSEWTGWWNYPENRGFKEFSAIDEKIKNLNIDYDSVLVIGIGGSYLGTRAVDSALSSPKPIYYCGHHLSSVATNRVLNQLATRKPMVCMISKSGTTTEPGLAFRIVRKWLEDKFGDEVNQRIIAITDPKKGALREMAEKKHWLTFSIPTDVGGRFSVLTAVGLVPLYLAGHNVSRMLTGADEEFKHILNSAQNPDYTHPAIVYAAQRFALWNAGKRIEALSIIEPDLHDLCEWWKQLFGESEGKHHKGLFPASLTFTTDLHSLGQYAQDGVRSLIETFLTFAPSTNSIPIPEAHDNLDELDYLQGKTMDEVNRAAMQATLLAHHDGEVPCMEIQFPALNEESLGRYFAFFETACAISALLLGVNPFDQPGVEGYKKNLFALMGRPGFEGATSEIKSRLT